MPILKINHVVSFSSEDSTHSSENLLSSDPAKKWKCATPGEKSATVVLQLEKASKISGIDVGNEHSAYIEVLVSRSGANDFKVLLVMSSFMNPIESRQSTNINKVRMFSTEHLSKPVCDEKWDLIKIVCTQPFNKHVQYGLSFITFHTPIITDNSSDLPQTLGKFTIREPSPDDLSAGSLFARRNQLKENEPPPTAAIAIRQSSETNVGSPTCKPKTKFTVTRDKTESPQTSSNNNKIMPSRNRDELLYSDDEVKANTKIDKIIEMKKKETDVKKQRVEEEMVDKKKKKKKQMETPSKKKGRPVMSESTKRKSSTTSSTPKKKPKINRVMKSFDHLLDGVVLVISGIQNPDRSNLRAAALSMGAKYKTDWDNTCTHLICAFPNTPKFNQVKGKGKIVTRKWIEECASQRKRLPWRRYALDKSDQDKNESEEEIWEKTEEDQDLPQKDNDDDDDNIENEPQEIGSDTEEEIARIRLQKQQEEDDEEKKNDPFEADTDHDSENSRIYDLELPDALPTFFNEKKFYVDKDSFEQSETELIKRYIVAYKGSICEHLSKYIEFVITKNAKNFPSKLCISPEWVWACHNSQAMLSFDDYMVT